MINFKGTDLNMNVPNRKMQHGMKQNQDVDTLHKLIFHNIKIGGRLTVNWSAAYADTSRYVLIYICAVSDSGTMYVHVPRLQSRSKVTCKLRRDLDYQAQNNVYNEG